MATTADVKKVARLVREQYPYLLGSSMVPGLLDSVAADLKLKEEQRELDAFDASVREAAEAGWNALRVKNPKVDRSNGQPGNLVESFADLPHKVKLNYLTFADGVTAALSVGDVEAAPEVRAFTKGDRVRVVSTPVWNYDRRRNRTLNVGDVVTIYVGEPDVDGDVTVKREGGALEFVRPDCLQLVESEPAPVGF